MIYIFDIDGTLTYPQKSLSSDIEKFLLELNKDNPVFFVTGSDYSLAKSKSQITPLIEKNINGIFACQGCELWQNGILVSKRDYEFPNTLIKKLSEYVTSSYYQNKTGSHINMRTGMINFSVIGRNASLSERKDYNSWDHLNNERKMIVNDLSNLYPYLNCTIGGEISIDIAPNGFDKSQIIAIINEILGYEDIMVFFGDKIYPGGNDYPLGKALIDNNKKNMVYNVNNPKQTLDILFFSKIS